MRQGDTRPNHRRSKAISKKETPHTEVCGAVLRMTVASWGKSQLRGQKEGCVDQTREAFLASLAASFSQISASSSVTALT